jgi:hypothetical protein
MKHEHGSPRNIPYKTHPLARPAGLIARLNSPGYHPMKSNRLPECDANSDASIVSVVKFFLENSLDARMRDSQARKQNSSPVRSMAKTYEDREQQAAHRSYHRPSCAQSDPPRPRQH